MNSRIVIDGPARLRHSEEFQARLRELREAIEAKYAAEMAAAGLFRRLFLRQRIAAEYRRELRKLVPSPESLYGVGKG